MKKKYWTQEEKAEARRAQARASYRKNIVARRSARMAYYYSNLDKVSERHTRYLHRHRYGIEDYPALLASQCGVCACCGTDDPGNNGRRHFNVDHDHETGKVRGLLCHGCNAGLGLFGDSVERLRLAISYLQRTDDADR